jgi:hypothetical protein
VSEIVHANGDLVLVTGSPGRVSAISPHAGLKMTRFLNKIVYPKYPMLSSSLDPEAGKNVNQTPPLVKEAIHFSGNFAVTKKGEFRLFSSKETGKFCNGELWSRYLFTKSEEFMSRMWTASHYEVD